VAIYDVTDDPLIQYAEAAKAEGIASILSVPIVACHGSSRKAMILIAFLLKIKHSI